MLFLKICGVTRVDQAQAIAALGIPAIGMIAVPHTPRYVDPDQMAAMVAGLPASTQKIGVVMDLELDPMVALVHRVGLTGIQLHGQESPHLCQQLQQALPGVVIIKAFRPRTTSDLEQINEYVGSVDRLLIDAYHPHLAGGSGQRADWTLLKSWSAPLPWILAGGLTPDNVGEAVAVLNPDGLDVSSGVESAPGIKDLNRVKLLWARLDPAN